jgi:mRNA interferase HigB
VAREQLESEIPDPSAPFSVRRKQPVQPWCAAFSDWPSLAIATPSRSANGILNRRRPKHVITRKRLNEFAERHSDTHSALAHWYRLMKSGRFRSFAHLRETFPSADLVGKFTVFNLGGNKARLIAALHYNHQKAKRIRAVLTHAEYDTGAWKP